MTYRERRPDPDVVQTGRHPIPDRRWPGRGPWLWLIALAAVLIVGAVIYGATNRQQEAATTPAVLATPAAVPHTPPPARQTTTGSAVAPAPATGQAPTSR